MFMVMVANSPVKPVMGVSIMEQPCWLLGLPDELKLQIANCLEQKRDLYNVSLTCRAMEDIVSRSLYAKVDVEVPQDKDTAWTTGGYLMFRPHVIRAMRGLTVRNGVIDVQSSVHSRRRRSDAGSVDEYLRQLLEAVPESQLFSFGFLHNSPISLETLQVLASRQANTLMELEFFELEQLPQTDAVLPHSLQTLGCRSILDGVLVGRLIQANYTTLQALRLGQENGLVERYRGIRSGFLEQIPQPLELFKDVVQLHNLPNLRRLDLCGLDVSSLIPASFEDAVLFCNLTRLSLESCSGSGAFLDAVARTFDFIQNAPDAPQPRTSPKLTEFLFRHEAPTAALAESTVRFLASFRGLKTLSVLFENASLLERVSTIIAGHGPTLETLVLESRIQPRNNLGMDTSRPFGIGGYSSDLWAESITDICNLCPNLIELGTGFPWKDEFVRVRKTPLPSLRKLRTINIRNFPESQVLSQLGDYAIKEFATKFIDWVFPGLVGADRPNLEMLAIGPTLYESRWKSNPSRRMPPEFARTHHYCLDWAKTRFHRWSVMITPVSEKFVEELREEKPLGGVFEQVWLR